MRSTKRARLDNALLVDMLENQNRLERKVKALGRQVGALATAVESLGATEDLIKELKQANDAMTQDVAEHKDKGNKKDGDV